MRRIIWILVLAALGWYAWGKYNAMVQAESAADAATAALRKVVRPAPAKPAPARESSVSFFTCDNRSCAQMTSCEEAKYFVRNCGMNPGASGEGAPSCEKQWCNK